ncbi:gluconokinase [Actinosynnema sp. NPDC047251]|uniref:Carbohydrate kinase FGGY n=1 Tax=Saccharothrix espanaensis (strain ATCC 51144 / DSM 44229 / JCM 9112 / NBRC 15066 / NRRL 15764) TaxID=1179773 RepID=K0JS30_SACES|nr:gluconokinase [Saccharothrix espanaensis]CCH27589.1 Carbohydrate kinase FGGY [Saccharothrix espanaensis DSM 44229]
MADAVLAVDLGTTATKVIAVDRDAAVLGSAEYGYPMRITPSGEATHDPEVVFEAALRALAEVAALGHRVHALVLTGAMHTLLGLDSGGVPVTPSLSWADNRAVAEASGLRGTAEGRALHRETGTPVHTMSPLVKLAWFRARGITADSWCGLKDYVALRLTGRLVTEYSSASGSGLMDLRALAWHPDALAFAGVRAAELPELLSPTTVLPLVLDVPGIPRGVPVVLGGGDGPMANLGVGAVVPGVAAVSLGTSGALRVVRDEPAVDEQERVFCYAIADGLWVLGGAVSNGGVVAQWAADTFKADVTTLLREAADVPPGASGVIALPYLLGERAPWWDPDARSALIGVRREHGRAEITRALVEGVAQQLALVLDAVRSVADVHAVRVTGGAFRSDLWASVLASALGLDLELAEDSEGSGVGAALLAWHALGDLPDLRTAATLIEPTRVIHPDAEAARYYAQHRPLVGQLYEALHKLG